MANFEIKKTKEPKLSPKMEALINRSHGEDYDLNDKYDNVERIKFKILKTLTENADLLWCLHNKEIEDKLASSQTDVEDITCYGNDYKGVSIFNFLKVPDIQSTVKNFVCFDVDEVDEYRYNRNTKRNQNTAIVHIIFRTISHESDVDTDYDMTRHDLMAAIIKAQLDWSNIFGAHTQKLYDKSRIADGGYYYREFIYEMVVGNNLINKEQNGAHIY